MSASTTSCVILAAGMSTRLRPQTDELPKCLLSVGGKTILERMVESVLKAGIIRISVVTGFQAGKIHSHLQLKFPSQKFHFTHNPDFSSTNNAFSLCLARDFSLETKDQKNQREHLLILDSDIIFHPKLLEMMKATDEENRLAVRVLGAHDDEEVRVGTDESGHVVAIGKGIRTGISVGESVGIEMFSNEAIRLLFDILDRRVQKGNGRTEYYETAFQEMIDGGTKIKATDVGDLPVVEVDSFADLEYAERVIVPKIDAMSHV